MYQVRRGVRAGDRPTAGQVNLGETGLPAAHLAADHPGPMHGQPRDRLLHVEHLDLPTTNGDQTGVGLLATTLGVERCRVEHQLDRLAFPRHIDWATRAEQRPYP